MDLKVESQPEEPKPARPQPSPRNFYARMLTSEMRRFRNGFTRENIGGFLKNMAWAVPLTILIWVYAEREEEVSVSDQTIAIEVKSNDPSKVVTLEYPREKMIICDLKGPRSNLDRFKETPSTSAPVTINLDTRQLPNGEEPLLTLQYLMENSRFKEAGITIDKCTPPTLTVYVDSLETRKLPVQSPIIGGLRSATFNPPMVSVTGPTRVLEQMTHVTADISALPSLNQPGPHPAQKVSLIADSSSLTYSPPQVDATLTVEEKDVTYTCKNVPVWFNIQPTTADQYAILVVNNSGFVPKVDVIGPPEQIAKLQQGEVSPPRAVLEIGPDNVHNTNPVPLTIEDLPDGVRVNGPNPEISFTATPRG